MMPPGRVTLATIADKPPIAPAAINGDACANRLR
jgi:hypothetical protein